MSVISYPKWCWQLNADLNFTEKDSLPLNNKWQNKLSNLLFVHCLVGVNNNFKTDFKLRRHCWKMVCPLGLRDGIHSNIFWYFWHLYLHMPLISLEAACLKTKQEIHQKIKHFNILQYAILFTATKCFHTYKIQTFLADSRFYTVQHLYTFEYIIFWTLMFYDTDCEVLYSV